MQKLCPVCLTTQEAIGFNLTEKEIRNLRQINLSEHICKSCYQEALSNMLEETKMGLSPLYKEQEIAQTTYHKAYNSWKEKADLYHALDYNISMIKFKEKKKAPAKINNAPTDPLDVELLCKQILKSLSKDQQEAIIKAFKASQNIEE